MTGIYMDSVGGHGLYVGSSGLGYAGVRVNTAGGHGLYVGSPAPGYDGVYVDSPGDDGLFVAKTGNATAYAGSTSRNGVEIGNAEGEGVYVNRAGGSGVYVNSTGGSGVSVHSAGVSGVSVYSAGASGVYVGSTGGSGVSVGSAGEDGVQVIHADDDGFFVCRAGSPTTCSPSSLNNGIEIGRTENNGMYVIEAGTNGVYANTTQASGQWGFYTPDMIHGSNVLLHRLSLVVQVSGTDALTPGDLVAAAGVADPLPGSTVSVPQVRLADGKSGGVVGVVETRLALVQAGELLPADDGSAPIEAPPPELHSAEGPAQPGDYVAITIYGAAQVKVDGAAAIEAGQRMTASSTPGQVRALRALKVQLAGGAGAADMLETAPVIGVALDAPRNGLVWVLVNPQ